jgi:hypothetical protein
MNGSGFGKAQVNVTSSTLRTNIVATTNMFFPSSAMTNTVGFVFGGPLPSGSSTSTVARIIGQAGYVWKATTVVKNGDKADNSDLEGWVTPASVQATTTIEVLSAVIDTNDACPGEAAYLINWHWSGSDQGTAQRVQFYEFDGELPADFDGNFANLAGAILKGERDVIGAPGDNCGEPPCCEVPPCPLGFDFDDGIFFCATPDSNHVYMVTDGIAVSLPCTLSFKGFLTPIGGADATGGSCTSAVRGFKLGSTIPVKIQLLSCDGTPITTGNHTISVVKCDNQVGSETPIDATPTDKATTGNLFRLTSASTGQWQFNLGTKQLSRGTWKIVVTLSNGSVHYVYIDLK